MNMWNVEGSDPDPTAITGPQPTLVTLHFLRNALRRRWLVWATAALLGALLASGWVWHAQSNSMATVTMLLAHDPAIDAGTAMATDVNLLDARAVAAAVIERQGLDMTPAELRGGVTAVPLTSQLLQLQVQGPDGDAAQRRAGALADAFLDFRGEQLVKQADAVIEGYRTRIAGMQEQMATLTSQYEDLSVGPVEQQSEAADVLTERSRISEQVALLQQTIEDTSLIAGSVVAASNVVDPPQVQPRSMMAAYILPIATGLIGGLVVGAGWVLAAALTSDRLRRRDEVALALAAPVRFSVRRLHRPAWWLLGRQARQRDLAAVVDGLSRLIEVSRGPTRLAIATVDDTKDAAVVLMRLARRCADRGLNVCAVDLSRDGQLEPLVAEARHPEALPDRGHVDLVRRGGVTRLATGQPGDWSEKLSRSQNAVGKRAQVVLTLARVDAGSTLDSLAVWSDDAVLLVATGGSSAERLRTVSEQFRASGVNLRFAVLTGADATDVSSGRETPARADGGVGRGTAS